jgi:2-pyrone-4,6-dicarboxylate lactonase
MLSPPEHAELPIERPLAGLGAWDCHVHVFGPRERYPLAAARRYTPALADGAGLLAHRDALGLDHLVLVQPSPYGTDNRCLIDALASLGPAARAIAALEPRDIDEARLTHLHALGVRGLRINPFGRVRALAGVAASIRATVERLRGTGWHVEVHCEPDLVRPVAAFAAAAAVPVVYDHVLGLEPAEPGFAAQAADLVALVAREPVWVKLSDRACRTREDRAWLTETIAALAEAAPDRLVWGSDWPHTPLDDGGEAPAPFRAADSRATLAWCASIVDASALCRILRDNPARLYG